MKSRALITVTMAAVFSASAALAQTMPSLPNPMPQQPQTAQHKTVPQKKNAVPLSKTAHTTAGTKLPAGAVTLISAPRSVAQLEQQRQDYAIILRGDEAMKAGDTEGAIAAFLEAKETQTQAPIAEVKLAEAYTAAGRTEEAIDAYRKLLYPAPGQDWSHTNQLSPTMQMSFSLLLLQTGQEAEALAAYRRALPNLNYDAEGRQTIPVQLPVIGPGGLPYSPQILQAMDCVGVGIDSPAGFDVPKLKEAVRLAPDSPVANFYLGRYLYSQQQVGAKAALERAIQLGDARTVAKAKEILPFSR